MLVVLHHEAKGDAISGCCRGCTPASIYRQGTGSHAIPGIQFLKRLPTSTMTDSSIGQTQKR